MPITMVAKTCVWCAMEFETRATYVKLGRSRYCSRSCASQASGGPKLKTESERFWIKVDKNGPIPIDRHDLGNCWIWIAYRNQAGYGWFKLGSRRDGTEGQVQAHIWLYEYEIGPVPDGLELDHLCRNRACVRPTHLEAVLHRINVLRGEATSAKNAKKTHCPKNHSYSGDNLIITSRGTRACRICVTEQRRAWGEKRKTKVAECMRCGQTRLIAVGNLCWPCYR